MADLLKTEAFVLKKNKLPGKDIMVTLFTEETGKVRVIAKGTKKITSRRAPHIQTGNLVNVILHRHQDYFYLEQSQLISGFATIKDTPEKLQKLYLILFLVDRLSPELQKENSLYKLLKSFMVEIAKKTSFTQEDTVKYIKLVLTDLGYMEEASKGLSDLVRDIEEIIHEKIPFSII